MSLLLKVVAEGIDPVMASFELGLSDMSEQAESFKRNYPSQLEGTIEKRISGPKALINRLFCTTRLMPFVQSIFPHPQPTSRSRRQNPANIFAIREWKCTQSGSKRRDHP